MSVYGVDHIVIRVKDLETAICTFRDKLGLALEQTRENEALGVKQAFFPFPGGGFLELVAPMDENSPVGRAVLSKGEGIHTISLAVDDLSETVEEMQNANVQLIGAGGPQVFVHPKSAHGVLVHLTSRK